MTTAARPLGFSPWALVAAIVVLVALLVTPALLVLNHNDKSAGPSAGTRALHVGRQPTDVAVGDDTVWIASGRDNGIVALDAAAPRARRRGTRPVRRRCGSPSARTRCGPPTPATTRSRV